MPLNSRKTSPQMPAFEFAALAQFKHVLRGLLTDGERICQQFELTPQRFEALLALATATGGPMTIGNLAHELQLRHHSAVELVTRLEGIGLLRRQIDPEDRRRVLLSLTDDGFRQVRDCARQHLLQLSRDRDRLIAALSATV